jgi:hypothetical protein
MLLVIVVCVLGLLTVVLALLGQRDPLDAPGPVPPDWDIVPTPSDLARVTYPLRVPGYDPATVDATFDLLAQAYTDLVAVADAATLRRARRRTALRLGLDPVSAAPWATSAISAMPTPAGDPAGGVVTGAGGADGAGGALVGAGGTATRSDADEAALRVVVALSAIGPQR